jgi:hypothetical protein
MRSRPGFSFGRLLGWFVWTATWVSVGLFFFHAIRQ